MFPAKANVVLLFISFLPSVVAFQSGSLRSTNVSPGRTAIELYAWTLPIDTKPAFGTWYTELHPTFRRTTYEDPPFEYSYVPLHDEWMSSKYLAVDTIQSSAIDPSRNNIPSASSSSSSPNHNRNPVRVAINFAKRIRFHVK